MTETLRDSVNWALKWIPAPVKTGAKEVERVVVREVTEVMAPSGRLFIRVAGVSGLLAVGLGAYGAHGKCSLYQTPNLCKRIPQSYSIGCCSLRLVFSAD